MHILTRIHASLLFGSDVDAASGLVEEGGQEAGGRQPEPQQGPAQNVREAAQLKARRRCRLSTPIRGRRGDSSSAFSTPFTAECFSPRHPCRPAAAPPIGVFPLTVTAATESGRRRTVGTAAHTPGLSSALPGAHAQHLRPSPSHTPRALRARKAASTSQRLAPRVPGPLVPSRRHKIGPTCQLERAKTRC